MVSKYLNGDYGSLKDIGAELASTFYAIDRFDAKAETVKTLEENGDILPKEAVTQRILSHI